MTGDRLPVFFLKGVGQGLTTALFRKETLTDPLEPMPTIPEWLASYGITPKDMSAFDQCEAEWYALLDRRKRRMDAFLAGALAGTCVYVALCLGSLALVGWLVWTLIL